MNHYDLGEIRTEKATSPTSPEKKERIGTEEPKTPRKIQGVAKKYICCLNSKAIYPDLTQEFLNNEFALAN